jgi:hypothetical protein
VLLFTLILSTGVGSLVSDTLQLNWTLANSVNGSN